MRDLKICLFTRDSVARLGSVIDNQVYDLTLTYAAYLHAENKGNNLYTLAKTIVPDTLEYFLLAGTHSIEQVRKSLDYVVSEKITTGLQGELICHPLDEVRLLAPIHTGTKVICFGDTFVSHYMTGKKLPEGFDENHPGVFYKMSQVVVGMDDTILIPKAHKGHVVGGTELTVVIGKEGRNIEEDEAEDYIWGYTIMNDVTLREQLNYMLGPTPKVFDTSAPIGPWIVPKDQIPNPLDLSLKLRISGHLDQDGSTNLMKFPIANLISVISKWHTLRPGDILATGDVGSKYPLNDQDVVEAEVGNIGVLRNYVKKEV